MTAQDMRLLEAARASIAADRLGETDPLIYIRAELAKRGQLPPAGMTPAECLALCPACPAADSTSRGGHVDAKTGTEVAS